MIRYEIDRARSALADMGRRVLLIDVDPQAKVAMTTFPEAIRLSELSKSPSKAAH
jgi:cellulose biosynthesis protein BcsQ